MPKPRITALKILTTTLKLADKRSWEGVRLHHVADELGVSLSDIKMFYREKEDIADAWFDLADQSMLKIIKSEGFYQQPTHRQIEELIMAWLLSLGEHQDVTKQIIMNKLEPGHLHVQLPAVFRISRTVQWIREAAHRDATFIERALEETGLTTIFISTFIYWLNDKSYDFEKTRLFLERRLIEGAALHEISNDLIFQPLRLLAASTKWNH